MILDRFALDGRVAVVTGAGLGIGRGIAIGLAEAGADVVLAAADGIRPRGRGRRGAGHRTAGPGRPHRCGGRGRLPTADRPGRRGVGAARHPGQQRRRGHAAGALDTTEGFMARTFAFNVVDP